LLLERAGLQALANPRTVLDNLDEALHAQYLTTNRNILDSKNSFITFGQKGAFSLTTSTQEESEAEPLQNFFPSDTMCLCWKCSRPLTNTSMRICAPLTAKALLASTPRVLQPAASCRWKVGIAKNFVLP
jgi:hypothetical protein